LRTKIFFSKKEFKKSNSKIVLDALTKNMEMLGGPENIKKSPGKKTCEIK
jgi:hypothetical protein